MTKTTAREEYTHICDEIFRLLMSGVSEDASVIVDLREAAAALEEEFRF